MISSARLRILFLRPTHSSWFPIFYEDRNTNRLLFLLLLSIGIPFVTTVCSGILENHIFLHRIHVYNKFNQFMSEKILKANYVFVEQESFIELRKKAEKYLY